MPYNLTSRQRKGLFEGSPSPFFEYLRILDTIYAGHRHDLNTEWTDPYNDVFHLSIVFGKLEIMNWLMNSLRDKSHLWRNSFTFFCAALSGNLEIVHVLRNQYTKQWLVPWDSQATIAAAFAGQSELFQYLYNHRCYWNDPTSAMLACRGFLELLIWARSQEFPIPWDEHLCAAAAYGGHLEVLKWARGQGCPWDDRTCVFAAKSGSLKVLQYARDCGCPWNGLVCMEATEHGHLNILRWARENGCPWNEQSIRDIVATKYPRIHEWVLANKNTL